MKTAIPNKPNRPRVAKQAPGAQTIHFELTNPSAQKVCIAGSFNGWKPEEGQMTRLGNGKWTKDLDLRPGTYEYRLVVDGKWMPDPQADHSVVNPFGEKNSLLTVSPRNEPQRSEAQVRVERPRAVNAG